MQRGISYLPEDCLAYKDGYRYGAYTDDDNGGNLHIVEWFKTRDEIQKFVNEHPEFGRQKQEG